MKPSALVVLALLPALPACLSDQGRGDSPDDGAPLADSGATPDAVAPDTAAPDAAAPDTAAPDAVAPDTAAPDTAAPDVTDPDDVAWPTDPPTEGLTVVVREGDEVRPVSTVHLSLDWPDHGADIARVQWFVDGPEGPAAVFMPSAFAPEVTLDVNLVGRYEIVARVWDAAGAAHVARSFTLLVVAGQGVHVELSWRTPGDVDETDTGGDQIYFSVGSDVDLHFLHPKAFDAFFDWSYDCFWDNVSPEWGIFGPEDNPSLDRDDTDGGGPEVIALHQPEPGAAFKVGVHYWNDWGYGAAYATLRVFRDGELVDEWADVELRNDEMWTAYVITDGEVARVGGTTPSIAANYRGLDQPHPSYVLRSDAGQAARAGTTFGAHIDTSDSSVSRVDWTLEAPAGSSATVTGTSMLDAEVSVDAPGVHTLIATVYGADGTTLATPRYSFIVAPAIALRVELTWRTPGDEDGSDTASDKHGTPAGSDLDLYLLHPDAGGDPAAGDLVMSWANPNPAWDTTAGFDDPALSADDVDGAGPEALDLLALTPGASYTLGVHYYRDAGFGPAYATLRVSFEDTRVVEAVDVALEPNQLWRAFTITDGTVVPIGDGADIAPWVLPWP